TIDSPATPNSPPEKCSTSSTTPAKPSSNPNSPQPEAATNRKPTLPAATSKPPTAANKPTRFIPPDNSAVAVAFAIALLVVIPQGSAVAFVFFPFHPNHCHPERSGSRHFVSHAVEGPAVL